MALICDATGKYLEGLGGSWGTNLTELSLLFWMKAIDYTAYGVGVTIGPQLDGITNAIVWGRDPHWLPNGSMAPQNASQGLGANQVLGQDNTIWHALLVTYKQNSAIKTYVDNSLRMNHTTSPVENYFSDTFSKVRIGLGIDSTGWDARMKIAQVAFWDKELTGGQATELWNGGSGGNGKNPTAVQGANLKLYVPLTDDISVHTGGISLTAYGSAAVNSSDNPAVDAPGGGASPVPVGLIRPQFFGFQPGFGRF